MKQDFGNTHNIYSKKIGERVKAIKNSGRVIQRRISEIRAIDDDTTLEHIRNERIDTYERLKAQNPTLDGFKKPVVSYQNIKSNNTGNKNVESHNYYQDRWSSQNVLEEIQFSQKQTEEGKEFIFNTLFDKSTLDSCPKEERKDLIYVASAFAAMDKAETGEYTAEELLNSVECVSKLKEKYKTNLEMQNNIEKLEEKFGSSSDDFEAMLKIKILNHPEAVNNDMKVIEECRKYVTNNKENIPQVFMDRLANNVEDLKDINKYKYGEKQNTDNRGVISASISEALKKQEEATKLNTKLNNELKKLETESNNKEYNAKGFIKDSANLVLTTARALVDETVAIGEIGVGIASSGATTKGKDSLLIEGVESVVAGYKTSNAIVSNVVDEHADFISKKLDALTTSIIDKSIPKREDEPIIENQRKVLSKKQFIDELKNKTGKIDFKEIFKNK